MSLKAASHVKFNLYLSGARKQNFQSSLKAASHLKFQQFYFGGKSGGKNSNNFIWEGVLQSDSDNLFGRAINGMPTLIIYNYMIIFLPIADALILCLRAVLA